MGHRNESIMVGGHPLSGELLGARYKVGRLSGWWERPAVKRQTLSRELGDGDLPQPWHFHARYITIGGSVRCQSHDQMHHIMDQLNGLGVARREYLTVQGHGQVTSALVEADDQPTLTTVTDTQLRFVLYFKANDPRRYGRRNTADVGNYWRTLRQFGNYPAYPLFNLTTDAEIGDSGFVIWGEVPGREDHTLWWYNWRSTVSHEIDFSTGRQYIGSLSRDEIPSRIRRSGIFTVPPVEHVRTLVRPQSSDDPGEISGTVSWRDTWI